VYSTKVFAIKDRTWKFAFGEVLSNGTYTADQGAGYPTISGSIDYTVDPTNTYSRLSFPVKTANSAPGILHSIRMVTRITNETCGFEPLAVGLFYHAEREHAYE
jgi:hypothetical protein